MRRTQGTKRNHEMAKTSGKCGATSGRTVETRRATKAKWNERKLARRIVLATLPAWKLAGTCKAEETDAWWENMSVKPALSVQQYVREIQTYRGQALAELDGWIESESYDKLSNALVIAPFANVQQACFYIPWAMLPVDQDRSYQAQLSYLKVQDCIDRLDRSAQDASHLFAEQEDVVQAKSRLESALDEFLRVVQQP
mmetsp:Transcript_6893/g.42064  ORF Transcript_6893/g.42064 Transcript_6893/m.42064 type:complete len:198 (-) Transcript_6893:1792-2385(-)